MTEQLFTSEEVSKILHVSRSFAYVLMKRGDIPTVLVGNAIRVRPEDLERYIERQSRNKIDVSPLQRKT